MDPTCEERIAVEMASREALIGQMFRIYDGEEEDDEELELTEDSLFEFGLGRQSYRVTNIVMSTGGPGDWLEVWQAEGDAVVDDGEVVRVTYHFNDWFDHAERVVEEGTAMWRYAEWAVGSF